LKFVLRKGRNGYFCASGQNSDIAVKFGDQISYVVQYFGDR